MVLCNDEVSPSKEALLFYSQPNPTRQGANAITAKDHVEPMAFLLTNSSPGTPCPKKFLKEQLYRKGNTQGRNSVPPYRNPPDPAQERRVRQLYSE